MADTDSVVDIRSRIQQFSNKNVDTNSNNITDGKPNPVPRLKPTNSNNNIKTENNANKLIPHTKPVLPIKPQPTPKPRSPKPVDNKRFDSQFHKQAIEPTSPISPKPPPKPKYDSDSASIDEKVNLKKLTSKNSNQILGNKPKPPVKPIALKTNTISPTNSEKLFLPRKISVDGNPPKPPRGNQRLSKYSYENHEIDNKESIKNSPLNNRTSTLDGLVILKQPPTDNEDESSSSDADDYDSPYEHVSASPKVQHKQLARSKNTYDHPDAAAVTGFMNSLGDSVDNEDYEDPDTIEFHPPTEVTLPKRMQSSESSDDNGDDDNYEEPPEDARLPSKHKEYDSSSDDGNYDMPEDIIPPAIPCHHTLPPQVPYHAQNNLQSSSSDEDIACPDYTDPELALYKPPVPITKIETLRRGSFFTPTDYIPNIESFVPDINEDEEYQDPEMAFATHMSHLNGDTPGTDTLDDDIYSDEPLYQVYSADRNDAMHKLSKKSDSEEIKDEVFAPDDIISNAGSVRLLWAHLPSVRNSGFLESVSPEERKRQEAMFEVITSEASYLKSLDILVTHFMMNRNFFPNPNLPSDDPNEEQLIDRHQYHFLFTGISAVKAVSERFLKDLRRRQQQSVLIKSISDILQDYAENYFQCYIKYVSNQVFQDRTLQALLHSSTRFQEVLYKLERDPVCQGLPMQSFLNLPMQRVTRLPLLVDAIVSRCETNSEEKASAELALKAISKLVHGANEGARKMERTEEMYFIQKMLTFKTKPIPLISASRWLVKKGDVMCLYEDGRLSQFKNQIRQIFKGKCKGIYLFLFTDIILICKVKGDQQYKVIDHCQRSLFKVEVMTHVPDPEPPKVGTLNINPLRYVFTLVLLENVNGKTVDYHCFLSTETNKTRWLEAFNPTIASPSVEGESVYDSFDCPQNQVIHPYQAQQSDELTLIEGDIIHVLRKLPDGWAEGQRMRDNERGWFPISYTDEIDSKHMRAKNLMQRYRLLTHSESIVNRILGK